MITVVDYGVGNIGAIINMADYLGIDAETSSDPDKIRNAAKLILPGVGAFDKAMLTLQNNGLIEPLNEAALKRQIPVLGICLGMQLLARRSDEGVQAGLGWVAADVLRITLPPESPLKVPHIGWLEVKPARTSALFNSAVHGERFYFDHGYYVQCDNPEDVAATIDYGSEICCAVNSGNVSGVQFHPEKSHRFGMRVLEAFGKI
ncbi:imidazole glycerol phosphate synthase subunit HisH [Rhizobium sp. BK377]|uniref:imidazole glycerol phosphate synthase subunit HisH n=1 Tax=Rhizobium sp. BK377 TaxID=2587058 RepID=UPI001620AADC|nr:imidazole glycerol phosphate synthase subunit HisH [Rhizobium sp. BK377]MBB3463077.1 glutamine amidotransferase [Rhizobium sp. BK377]